MARVTYIHWTTSSRINLATSLSKYCITFLILTLISLSNPSYAVDTPTFQYKAFSAEYEFKKINVTLSIATFSLQKIAKDTWLYSSKIKPIGIARIFSKDEFSEASSILFKNGQLTPISYQYTRTGKKPEIASINYDWLTKQATFNLNGQIQNITLKNNHQDRYSMMLALMQATAQGQQSMQYQVIDKSMKLRNYIHNGEKEIKTALGKQNTIHILQDSNQHPVHYWLSPELNYIPVRIEKFKAGKSQLQLTLKNFRWTN